MYILALVEERKFLHSDLVWSACQPVSQSVSSTNTDSCCTPLMLPTSRHKGVSMASPM